MGKVTEFKPFGIFQNNDASNAWPLVPKLRAENGMFLGLPV